MRTPFNLRVGEDTLELGNRTCIMGILNVTPDSFYDAGRHFDIGHAAAAAERMVEDGADIVDIGGQSTRPQSEPVGTDEELRRVLPVLRAIKPRIRKLVSIDTYRSEVARVCLSEGADIINDVSSFRMDPEMPKVIASLNAPVVCMHFLKSIHPMPADPEYVNLKEEILEFFQETFRIAANAGLSMDRVIVDPGIGFGKKLEHNLEIIRYLSFLQPLNCPILAGPSRKSFIQKLTGLPAENRLEGTAAAAAFCLQQGAHILRVHDVLFFRRFCDVFDALLNVQSC
jgi:dihydropteroate synthase